MGYHSIMDDNAHVERMWTIDEKWRGIRRDNTLIREMSARRKQFWQSILDISFGSNEFAKGRIEFWKNMLRSSIDTVTYLNTICSWGKSESTKPHSCTWRELAEKHKTIRCNIPLDCPLGLSPEAHVFTIVKIPDEVKMQLDFYPLDTIGGTLKEYTANRRVKLAEIFRNSDSLNTLYMIASGLITMRTSDITFIVIIITVKDIGISKYLIKNMLMTLFKSSFEYCDETIVTIRPGGIRVFKIVTLFPEDTVNWTVEKIMEKTSIAISDFILRSLRISLEQNHQAWCAKLNNYEAQYSRKFSKTLQNIKSKRERQLSARMFALLLTGLIRIPPNIFMGICSHWTSLVDEYITKSGLLWSNFVYLDLRK